MRGQAHLAFTWGIGWARCGELPADPPAYSPVVLIKAARGQAFTWGKPFSFLSPLGPLRAIRQTQEILGGHFAQRGRAIVFAGRQ